MRDGVKTDVDMAHDEQGQGLDLEAQSFFTDAVRLVSDYLLHVPHERSVPDQDGF